MKNKGFEIKCLDCRSTNVKIKENYEYNWDEELEFDRVVIVCNDCGQEE